MGRGNFLASHNDDVRPGTIFRVPGRVSRFGTPRRVLGRCVLGRRASIPGRSAHPGRRSVSLDAYPVPRPGSRTQVVHPRTPEASGTLCFRPGTPLVLGRPNASGTPKPSWTPSIVPDAEVVRDAFGRPVTRCPSQDGRKRPGMYTVSPDTLGAFQDGYAGSRGVLGRPRRLGRSLSSWDTRPVLGRSEPSWDGAAILGR